MLLPLAPVILYTFFFTRVRLVVNFCRLTKKSTGNLLDGRVTQSYQKIDCILIFLKCQRDSYRQGCCTSPCARALKNSSK